MYYARARYYAPNMGRWLAPDPIGFAGGDINLYRYCNNDPVNMLDPTGNMAAFGLGIAADQANMTPGNVNGGISQTWVAITGWNPLNWTTATVSSAILGGSSFGAEAGAPTTASFANLNSLNDMAGTSGSLSMNVGAAYFTAGGTVSNLTSSGQGNPVYSYGVGFGVGLLPVSVVSTVTNTTVTITGTVGSQIALAADSAVRTVVNAVTNAVSAFVDDDDDDDDDGDYTNSDSASSSSPTAAGPGDTSSSQFQNFNPSIANPLQSWGALAPQPPTSGYIDSGWGTAAPGADLFGNGAGFNITQFLGDMKDK